MIKSNWKAHSDDIAIKLIRVNAMLSEPILESKGMGAIFQKKDKEMLKKDKVFKNLDKNV